MALYECIEEMPQSRERLILGWRRAFLTNILTGEAGRDAVQLEFHALGSNARHRTFML